MDKSIFSEILKNNGIGFTENEPMKNRTTFRIGGAADFFVMPENEKELIFSVKSAIKCEIPYFIIGRGSNLLFDDAGYRGAVFSTEKLNNCKVSCGRIECGCGASFTAVSHVARDAGLTGLEFANGIPGYVGGAVYMNAGAYGGEVSDVLYSSTYYDTQKDEIETISLPEHEYGYRESVYINNKGRIILSAVFELLPGNKDEIKAKMDDYMERRRSKQPLEYPSAGSVFKRCEGHYTGQMIEELGLKGFSIGGAEISEKHAGFIINKNGATSEDVLKLVSYITAKVKEKYGLDLCREVIYVK